MNVLCFVGPCVWGAVCVLCVRKGVLLHLGYEHSTHMYTHIHTCSHMYTHTQSQHAHTHTHTHTHTYIRTCPQHTKVIMLCIILIHRQSAVNGLKSPWVTPTYMPINP